MRFGSVCSGIEAASVAWHPLGWRAAWLSEIEPFPCAVLAHHYPDVPNLGDMTTLPARILAGEVEAPDVFCGGTPCQAFSVAGLRRSLDDARGNLSLTFCEIANAIDTIRAGRGEQPATIFWENVPGVLSTKDNAFGCFLAGLAGESGELQPPGGRWANAGCVFGPQRAVAWRVLDAQYFGVAQRRRRVFVVASARSGFDPAAVLFEWDGVRRDTAPSREAGQSVTPCVTSGAGNGGAAHRARSGSAKDNLIVPVVVGPLTAACGPNGHGGSGLATDKGAEAGHILAFGGNNTGGPIEQAAALNANRGCHNPGDFEAGTLLVQETAHTLRGEGFDASEDGSGRGTPLVPVLQDGVRYAHYSHDYANDRITDPAGINPALTARTTASGNLNVLAPVAFPANLSATQHASTENLSPALGAKNPTAVALAVALRGREGGATAELGDEVQNCLRASSGGGDKPHVLAPAVRDISQTLTSNYGKQVDSSDTALGPNVVFPSMQVRRLTPTECERLQGFPDGYTAIPWRKKPASDCPDGPRYKALGNSWAVPNVRWIGQRIAAALQALEHANDNGEKAEAAA